MVGGGEHLAADRLQAVIAGRGIISFSTDRGRASATNASVASGQGRPTVIRQSRSRLAMSPGSSPSQRAAPAASALFLTTAGTWTGVLTGQG